MLSKWVKELLDNSHPQNSPWKTIPMHILEKFGKGGLIFKINLDNTSKLGNHVKNIPTFYQNIINSWIEIGGGQTEKPNTPGVPYRNNLSSNMGKQIHQTQQ